MVKECGICPLYTKRIDANDNSLKLLKIKTLKSRVRAMLHNDKFFYGCKQIKMGGCRYVICPLLYINWLTTHTFLFQVLNVEVLILILFCFFHFGIHKYMEQLVWHSTDPFVTRLPSYSEMRYKVSSIGTWLICCRFPWLHFSLICVLYDGSNKF